MVKLSGWYLCNKFDRKHNKSNYILPRYLRSKFYRDFKDANFSNQPLNSTTLKIWLGNKVTELFNPIYAIIDHQEKKGGFYKNSHRLERDNRNLYPRPPSLLLHCGKACRIINRTYCDADFVSRMIWHKDVISLWHFQQMNAWD